MIWIDICNVYKFFEFYMTFKDNCLLRDRHAVVDEMEYGDHKIQVLLF